MSALLAMLADSEGIYLEPSALAGMYGPVLACSDGVMKSYADALAAPGAITHLVWATGGSMVPAGEMQKYYAAGKSLL